MINELFNFSKMDELINLFSLAIPEGTDSVVEAENKKIHLTKKDGKVNINVEEVFNDSGTKNRVKKYKKAIEELDDSLFIEVIEQVKKEIDVSEFDALLELKQFTKEQSDAVLEMINVSSEIISSYIETKIQDLIELHSKF